MSVQSRYGSRPVHSTLLALAALMAGCVDGPAPEVPTDGPAMALVSEQEGALSSIDCGESQDTGYKQGTPFTITLVTVDGKKVEKDTANAYYVMAQAADKDGVTLKISSGFRTMAEQQYFYDCYVNCSCNSCNQAAQPGYSNHQSGHALDLNTSSGGVLAWLNAHGGAYGFARTVPSEEWHWEWWGGGPGGGPCTEKCTPQCNGTRIVGADCKEDDCATFGASCVADALGPRCVFDGCPPIGGATLCFDDSTLLTCSDGSVEIGDCEAEDAWCSTAGGAGARCVSKACVASPETPPLERDVCLPGGARAHCDADGGLSDNPCPGGAACVPGATATCASGCSPTEEECNGVDDDCDGAVDEGVGEGGACEVGAGACASVGTLVCDGADGLRCVAEPVSCDDGDPCTLDECVPDVGCTSLPGAGCCSAAAPCPLGTACEQGVCLAAYCLPCTGDEDCRGGGSCVELDAGSACSVPCDGGKCPKGAECLTIYGLAQCVPLSRDCTCDAGAGTECLARSVVRTDGCGRALAVLEPCDRGCAAGACCPVGTEEKDGACATSGGDSGGAGGGWSVPGVGGDASGGGDADAQVTSGGCAAAGGGGRLGIVAASLLLVLAIRGERRRWGGGS